MMPAAPASRTRRTPSRSRDAARDEQVGVHGPRQRGDLVDLGLAGRMPEDEAPDAATGELGEEVGEGGRRGPAPRERGEPIGSGVEAHRQPVARRLEAARSSGGSSATARLVTTRVAPAANARRIASGGIEAAGELEGRRDARRDRADRLEVDRSAAPGAIEVDDVDHRRPEADEVLRDPLRPIRRRADARGYAGPEDDPRAPLLDVDRRDDLHEPARRAQPPAAADDALAAQRPAVEEMGSEPPRRSASWKSRSEKPAPSRRCSSARSWSSSTLPSR